MIPNHYERERLTQIHCQDRLREAEHERLVAQLSQHTRKAPLFVAQLILSLRILCIRLQRGFQRRGA